MEGEVSSKRRRLSRIVHVNGYAVKRENMYSLEEGEPSVWDSEMRRGAHEETEEATDVKGQPLIAKKSGKSHPKHLKKPKVLQVSEPTQAKHVNNQLIKTAIEAAKHKKRVFIGQHWKYLSPFIEGTCPTYSEESPPSSTTLSHQPQYLVNVNMREYQLVGLNWLIKSYEYGVNVILGDEMGLGKTLQTIAFLGWLKYERRIDGPFLITVPLSVITNWVQEFKRFLPNMRVLKLHTSDPQEKERLKKEGQLQLFDNTWISLIFLSSS